MLGHVNDVVLLERVPGTDLVVSGGLDGLDERAHHLMAGYFFRRQEWPKAIESYRRAIELNPSYATAHQWYGEMLTGMGRHEEAMRLSDLVTRPRAWMRPA